MKKTLLLLLFLLCTSAHAEEIDVPKFEEITEISTYNSDDSLTADNSEHPGESATDTIQSSESTDGKKSPKQVDLYINGTGITLSNFPIIENNTLMLPLKELLSNLKIYDFSVDTDNQITLTYGKKLIVLYIDSNTAYLNGSITYLPEKTVMINDTVYAPMRTVCEHFGFSVTADCTDRRLTVHIDDITLKKSDSTQEAYVNSVGLSSQTPYLIWINKKDYKVYVFLGSAGDWKHIYSCTCAIGKNETPTITGTYKFFSLEKRWNYDDFYVGPIMRFHGGYAIHSTLLKYDGTNYNATVGKKLSHGCIRVRPNDINWLVSYVPLKTTIHITEK